MIASLRGKHDPHYKLAGRVDRIEKEIPIQLSQLHKTLSKSFGMQRKTLMRVLGLENRLSNLETGIEIWTTREAFRRQQEKEEQAEVDAVEEKIEELEE